MFDKKLFDLLSKCFFRNICINNTISFEILFHIYGHWYFNVQLPKWTELKLGIKRFLFDMPLVLCEWVISISLNSEFSTWGRFFYLYSKTNFKISSWNISLIFSMFNVLKSGLVWAWKLSKVIILIHFFWSFSSTSRL